MAWRVVTPNAGLVSDAEVLALLRQRGLRTAAEAAGDEEAATAALEAATAALSVEEVEGEDGAVEGEEGEEAAAQRAAAAAAAAEATRVAALPPPFYPRLNPPFRVERAVFDRLMLSPAARQDPEELETIVGILRTVDLTQVEVLQLLNTQPSTIVELHCIVEQADSRLSAEEQAELLTVLQSVGS